MIIGSCKIKLLIFHSQSLKDKRRVIKSLIGKLKCRFNIAIAEVEENEVWNYSVIGFTCVANESTLVNEIIDKVISFIDCNGDTEIVNIDRELL